MPPTNPTPLPDPQMPSQSQLVQEYIDSLLQEGASELGLKAPGDIARVLSRTSAIMTDFSLREKDVDEDSMRWLKRQARTALSSAKVRNLGRINRAQIGAINLVSGVAKLAIAAMLAQVTPGTTLDRFSPSA